MSGEVFPRKVQKNRTVQIPSHFITEHFTVDGVVVSSIELVGDYNLKDKVVTLYNSNCYYIGLKKYCGLEPGDFVEISVVVDSNKLRIKKVKK